MALKISTWTSVVATFLMLFYMKHSSALYEDQAGKFDWKKEFIGEVKTLFLVCLRT